MHLFIIRKLFFRIAEMELDEINALKRRYFDARQQNRESKARMRQQRERSKQLIAACAQKLQEKELQIETVRFLLLLLLLESPGIIVHNFRYKPNGRENYPS